MWERESANYLFLSLSYGCFFHFNWFRAVYCHFQERNIRASHSFSWSSLHLPSVGVIIWPKESLFFSPHTWVGFWPQVPSSFPLPLFLLKCKLFFICLKDCSIRESGVFRPSPDLNQLFSYWIPEFLLWTDILPLMGVGRLWGLV